MLTQMQFLLPPIVRFAEHEFQPAERIDPESIEQAIETCKEIESLYSHENVPEPLSSLLTRQVVFEFQQAFQLLDRQRMVDRQWLERLLQQDFLCSGSSNAEQLSERLQRLLSRLVDELPRELSYTREQSLRYLENALAPTNFEIIRRGAELDSSDSIYDYRRLASGLLNQGRVLTILRLAEAFSAAELFSKMSGERLAIGEYEQEFMALVTRFQDNMEANPELVQLPECLGDELLLAAATREFAESERWVEQRLDKLIVISGDRVRSRARYQVDFQALTIKKLTMEWSEFQVATIENEGTSRVLYFNQFTKPPADQPPGSVDDWRVSGRLRLGPLQGAL